jgi:citrate lyase subunit beta/citryl-CoA lyase
MRSFLFVPAGSLRMLVKSRDSDADVLIFDLEDAVQAGAKQEARALLVGHLSERRTAGPQIAVRINGLRTPWIDDDLRAVIPLSPDYVMLPKSEGVADIADLAARLAPLEREGQFTRILVVATETVASVLSLASQPWSHPRLSGMLWGAEDLAANLHATGNRVAGGSYSSPFRLARDLCLMAARRAGVFAIDAVHTDLRNLEALDAEAREARQDGFDGKAAIHPSQVSVINTVFRPTEAEIAWSKSVLTALEASTTGVAVVDGQMVDAPHAARAQMILLKAQSR